MPLRRNEHKDTRTLCNILPSESWTPLENVELLTEKPYQIDYGVRQVSDSC
jgi:hypothetical protein